MEGMFQNCKALTSLDLSSFDTSNVTNMNEMFANCSSLATIYASNSFDTTNVSNSSYMFTGCSSLVGGNRSAHGTDTSTSKNDKTYAVIDTANTPGYFTAKS